MANSCELFLYIPCYIDGVMEHTQEEDLDFCYNQCRMGYTRIIHKS
jgi:hypothetical protein